MVTITIVEQFSTGPQPVHSDLHGFKQTCTSKTLLRFPSRTFILLCAMIRGKEEFTVCLSRHQTYIYSICISPALPIFVQKDLLIAHVSEAVLLGQANN